MYRFLYQYDSGIGMTELGLSAIFAVSWQVKQKAYNASSGLPIRLLMLALQMTWPMAISTNYRRHQTDKRTNVFGCSKSFREF